jgi:hypothetical protein
LIREPSIFSPEINSLFTTSRNVSSIQSIYVLITDNAELINVALFALNHVSHSLKVILLISSTTIFFTNVFGVGIEHKSNALGIAKKFIVI